MRRTPQLLTALTAAALLLAGGALHLRDWLSTYRAVPWAVPGAWVVRVGFLMNAVVALVLAVALVATAIKARRLHPLVIAAALGMQVASLAALVLSRGQGVFGWIEAGWTTEAKQVLALEIAAIAVLATAAAMAALRRTGAGRRTSRALGLASRA